MKSAQLDSHSNSARTASSTTDLDALTPASDVVASRVGSTATELPVALIGQCSGWFQVRRDGAALILEPRRPLPRRCTIRPAVMFDTTADSLTS